jgi:hypothetical protein
MALTPLDPTQEQAVSALVTARRLEQVPVDLRRAELFLEFDQMRRARNQLRYEASSVGEADADVASRAARALRDGAAARGI